MGVVQVEALRVGVDLEGDPLARGIGLGGRLPAFATSMAFAQATIGANNAPGCITCHSLEPDVVIVGPSQAGLATRAETRVPGMSAADYIRQSIVEPNAHIVEGFAEGLMYQNYATDLTEDQINDLVAYTLTLE